MKKKVIIFGLVILTGLLVWSFNHSFQINEVTLIQKNNIFQKTLKSSQKALLLQKVRSPAQQNLKNKFFKKDDFFQKWFDGEADKIVQQGNNQELELFKLKVRARELTFEQSMQLKNIALKKESSISSKLLASYLLTLGQDKTEKALKQFLLSPLSYKTNAKPHTVNALLSMQEKSIRYMVIDRLVEEAQHSKKAYSKLAQLSRQIKEPVLKSYMDKLLQ